MPMSLSGIYKAKEEQEFRGKELAAKPKLTIMQKYPISFFLHDCLAQNEFGWFK